jgi:hypothetical protein
MLSKRKRKWILIILIVILFLVFFRGFRIFAYDDNNEHIGTSFQFNQPMVYLSDLPDEFVGKKIAEKYGSIIFPKQTWDNSTANLPGIRVDEVDCAEIFTIKGAISRISIGVLERAFSGGTMKFFLIGSDEHRLTIIGREHYDWYAREGDSTVISPDCAEPS